jgi:DNA-binding GntR family transcriptional regulator
MWSEKPFQSLNSASFKTREELVTDAIRAAIVEGKFRPGEKLDQQEIADQLSVSRSPVREALRTLMAEDLVTQYPHRGAVVTERSPEELQEILSIRTHLEGLAAFRAAPMMDNDRLAMLDTIMKDADQISDMETVLGLNNDFHSVIYNAYHQPHLIKLIQQMRNKIAPYNRIYLELEGKKEVAWEDHRRIYEACLRKDAEKAEIETRKHLEQVFQGILSSIELA